METHIEHFTSTAIVIVEIKNEEKISEIRYITIGTVGKATEADLGKDALLYLNNVKGQKEVKRIIFSNSEKYRDYLENAINNHEDQ